MKVRYFHSFLPLFADMAVTSIEVGKKGLAWVQGTRTAAFTHYHDAPFNALLPRQTSLGIGETSAVFGIPAAARKSPPNGSVL